MATVFAVLVVLVVFSVLAVNWLPAVFVFEFEYVLTELVWPSANGVVSDPPTDFADWTAAEFPVLFTRASASNRDPLLLRYQRADESRDLILELPAFACFSCSGARVRICIDVRFGLPDDSDQRTSSRGEEAILGIVGARVIPE